MATIVPRRNDRGELIGWRVQVRRKGFKSQSKTFRNKRDAEAWAATTESEMSRGIWVDRSEAERTTLKQALERYINEYTPKLRGSDKYIARARAIQRHPLAPRFLATIRGADIAEFRDERLAKVSANTVRLDLALLSRLFSIARREWRMEGLSNPVELVSKPKLPGGRKRRISHDEESSLIEAAAISRNKWLVPAIRLAIETAMRAGELLNLTWNYIDLNKRVAHLPKTKNGEARDVPLSSRAIKVLQQLSITRDITEPRVLPITYRALNGAFTTARGRVQLKDLRFHDLRHEATSRLFELGTLDMMEISRITGHKTLTMLSRYTHLKAEDLAKKMG